MQRRKIPEDSDEAHEREDSQCGRRGGNLQTVKRKP